MAVLSPRLGAGWESKLKLRKREWEMTQSLAVAPVCWDAVLGQVRPSLLLHRSGRALRGAPASSPPGLGARTLSGSQLFLLQHRGTGAPQLSSFPWLTEISLEREEGLLTLVPENFLCNTGCMAKAPGERGATLKTGRKEEGESFMAVTSLYEETAQLVVAAVVVVVVAAAAAALRLGAYRVSQPCDLRINDWQISTLRKSGTGTGRERGSTSLQLQNSSASAFWTSHKFQFTSRKSKFCLINTNQQTRVKAEEKYLCLLTREPHPHL